MKSMTGFGRATVEEHGWQVSVEARALNQRFLEIKLGLPRGWTEYEQQLRRLVQRVIHRGRVEVVVRVQAIRQHPGRVVVNLELARRYVAEVRRLSRALNLDGAIGVEAILQRPELVRMSEEETDTHAQVRSARKAIVLAVDALDAARVREGKALQRDFMGRMRRVAAVTRDIERRARAVRSSTIAAFQRRVRELLHDAAPDEKRLYEEAVNVAQRADVSEEVVRLQAHLKALATLLGRSAPVGKEIEFLLQELNREANTIGAKSQDVRLSRLAIQIKSEIEKMREQAQNVE
jgi:uncharacterized protein (TIGR00255 family)